MICGFYVSYRQPPRSGGVRQGVGEAVRVGVLDGTGVFVGGAGVTVSVGTSVTVADPVGVTGVGVLVQVGTKV